LEGLKKITDILSLNFCWDCGVSVKLLTLNGARIPLRSEYVWALAPQGLRLLCRHKERPPAYMRRVDSVNWRTEIVNCLRSTFPNIFCNVDRRVARQWTSKVV